MNIRYPIYEGVYRILTIEASLLDEITLYIVPVMLGDGIKFIGKTFGSKWELTGHRVIDNQVVYLTYQYKGE
jgi:dihydrofolate reductase